MTKKAEIREMQPQTKECLKPQAGRRKGFSPRAFRGSVALDFRLLDSKL